MFKVYILRSQLTEKYYIGQTKDLAKRLEWHNSQRARWTKRFQPWEIVYTESFETRSEAVIRERVLKAAKNIKQFLSL